MHGRARSLLGVSLLALLLVAPLRTHADDPTPDERAKALYATYLLERKDKSWGAFRRRLTALRSLGAVECERAWASLLKVARTGRALDDRVLATQGIARAGGLDAVKNLLALLAKKGHPVLTQVAGEGLAATQNGDVVVWLSQDSLDRPLQELPPVLRAHATLATPEAAARLRELFASWAGAPRAVDLAHDAVQALGRGAAPESLSVLQAASQSAEVVLRLAAADVMAYQDPDEAQVGAAVQRLLEDPDARVQRATAEGIAAAKRDLYVPAITHLLDAEDPRTRKTALDILRRLTKKDFGMDGGAWRRWWEQRDLPDAPKPHTVATYHGLPIFTERVVFVLDRSGSMNWPHATGERTRMDVARDALTTTLGSLSPRTRFNVISFDTKVRTWRKGESDASPKDIASAVKWVGKQDPERGAGTNTYEVLETAYAENPEIDTIYLLSDGIPEDGDITTSEGLLAAVRVWNRYRRVKIHTIALTLMYLHPGKYPITSSMRRAEAFMKDLARIGGGGFQHVSRPPPPK